ncbi:MAG: CbiQ family ECF transporter T component [Desulfovibrio sp.]|jgi:biotin transport system permease protein
MSRWGAGFRSVLNGVDPRAKILFALVLGACVWRASWAGLALYLAFLGAVVWMHRLHWPEGGRLLRTYAGFVCFWGMAKFLLDLFWGAAWEAAAIEALLVVGRVSCLLLLGTALTMTTSARALGAGLCSMLRPCVGRQRAWTLALAFALMIHFLPLTWRRIHEVRSAVKRRCPGLGWYVRMPLMAQAVLRGLAALTWDQSLAVAARGLDRAEAWQVRFDSSWREWMATMLLLAGLAAFALL